MRGWPPKIRREISALKSTYGSIVGRQISPLDSLACASEAASEPLRSHLMRLRLNYLIEGYPIGRIQDELKLRAMPGSVETPYSGVPVGLSSNLMADLRSYTKEVEVRLGLVITGGFGAIIFLASLGAVGLLPRILFVASATLFSLLFLLLRWEEIELPSGPIRVISRILRRPSRRESRRSGGSSYPSGEIP